MSELIEVKVPDIGDFDQVDVIEVLVSVGDVIEAEQPLLTLESDKASMEIPSSHAGKVEELLIQVGDKVSEGTVVLKLSADAASGESEAAQAAESSAAPEPAAAASASSETVDVCVPDIGDFDQVDVIEVLVSVGDVIEAEQALLTLESDKASMEIPSSHAGTVKEVLVNVGDKVSEGTVVAKVETGAAAPAAEAKAAPAAAAEAPKSQPAPAPAAAPKSTPPAAAPQPASDGRKIHASPSVRKFARELGVDLSRVTQASGPKGRLLREDIQNFVKGVMSGASAPAAVSGGTGIPPIPEVDFSKFGEIEVKPLSKIKRLTGANLTRAWLNLPMVTHHDVADITDMEAFRKSLKGEAEKRGVKVTFLLFIMKALVAALKDFPTFNSSLSADGESLIYKKYFNVGIAVATPNGLVVPVFKDVDKKNVYDLAAEMSEVSAKARDGKLSPKEMQGASMTISSLGGIGGTAFSPIVNPPEVAILGVTRSDIQPVWNGKEFVPRLMLPLDVTYDHRVIDGADVAAFVVALAGYLNDIRRVLL